MRVLVHLILNSWTNWYAWWMYRTRFFFYFNNNPNNSIDNVVTTASFHGVEKSEKKTTRTKIGWRIKTRFDRYVCSFSSLSLCRLNGSAELIGNDKHNIRIFNITEKNEGNATHTHCRWSKVINVEIGNESVDKFIPIDKIHLKTWSAHCYNSWTSSVLCHISFSLAAKTCRNLFCVCVF